MSVAMFRVKHPAGEGRKGSGGGLALAAGALALALPLPACSAPQERGTAAAAAASTATPVPPVPPAPPAPTPGAVAFEDNAKSGEAARDFAYAWPAAVSAVPALESRLAAERDRLLAAQKKEWEEALREFAGQDCVGCVNRSFEKSWEVVADLPRFLSLSASFSEYTGGAHGNGAFDALVWDRKAAAAFDPKTMFTAPAALQDALGDAWCKALKAEKMKRMGEGYSDDGFFPCPPVADLTVLAGSSDGKTFDRIGLIAAPYVAGSYAEGAYEVTLPVTARVIAAVKPEYKAAFAPAK